MSETFQFESWKDDELLSYYTEFLRKKKLLSPKEEHKYASDYQKAIADIKILFLYSKATINTLIMHLKSAKVSKLRMLFVVNSQEKLLAKEVRELSEAFVAVLESTRIKKSKAAQNELKAELIKMNMTLSELIRLLEPHAEVAEELKAARQRADAARTVLVERNLRLAFGIAKKYCNKGLSITDLIQEANLGLLRAIDKYDPTKGIRFSTYATWWINQACGRALADKSRMIRLPVYLVEKNQKLNKSKVLLSKKTSQAPSNAALSEMTGISLTDIDKLEEMSRNLVPLENEMYEDFLATEKSNNTLEESLNKTDLERVIRKHLSRLSPQEEKIVRLFFGIGEPKGRII